MDEKQTPDKTPSQPQPPSAIHSILKEISSKTNPPSSPEAAKTPLDNLKSVLTAADSKIQQETKTNPIAIKTVDPQQTSEKTSASAGPSANRVLVDSEAVRKLDELIQAHRSGKP